MGWPLEDPAIVSRDAQAAHTMEGHRETCLLQGRIKLDAHNAIIVLVFLQSLPLKPALLLEATGANDHAIGGSHAATGMLTASGADARLSELDQGLHRLLLCR
jgi:hypothetical protein